MSPRPTSTQPPLECWEPLARSALSPRAAELLRVIDQAGRDVVSRGWAADALSCGSTAARDLLVELETAGHLVRLADRRFARASLGGAP